MGNLRTPSSVQKLESALHAKAKEEPGYRFYLLYDKVHRADVLEYAYRCCKANKGAAGVDGQRFEHDTVRAVHSLLNTGHWKMHG